MEVGQPTCPYKLLFFKPGIYMIGEVWQTSTYHVTTMLTRPAGVAFCHVNTSRWGNPVAWGRLVSREKARQTQIWTRYCLWRKRCIIKTDNKKPQHWKVETRVGSERKRALTTKMRPCPAIFPFNVLSDHVVASRKVKPGPLGGKIACKRKLFFDPT